MALASITGNYAGGQEASGPDLKATLDSFLARINSVTLEQMSSGSVGTSQLVDSSVTLGEIAFRRFYRRRFRPRQVCRRVCD